MKREMKLKIEKTILKGEKDYMKKLVCMILAIMMITMVGAASASTLTNGKAGESYLSANEGQKVDNYITFPKQIVIFNTTDSTVVYNPNISYTYSISAGSNTHTVKDGDNDRGNIYSGPVTALAATDSNYDLTAAFSSASTTTATTKGVVAEDNITIVFNPDQFEHAGIFRYVITESDSSTARTAAGITRVGTDTVRYLDVYVRVDSSDADNDNSTTDFVIYGYVLSTADDSKNENNTTTDPKNTDADAGLMTKTSGFLADYDTTTGVVTKGDYYNTYNLKVVKNVAGSLADTNEQFPFGITFSNSTITSRPIVGVVATYQSGSYSATNETFAATGTLSIGTGTSESTLKLKDDDYIVITGIPADITSSVTEYNSSYDIYRAEITTTAPTGGTATHTEAKLNPNQTTTITAVTGTNMSTTNTLIAGDLILTVTNNLEVVSPTGIVTRYAPYGLILVAGVVLLVIAMKRRKNTEED